MERLGWAEDPSPGLGGGALGDVGGGMVKWSWMMEAAAVSMVEVSGERALGEPSLEDVLEDML